MNIEIRKYQPSKDYQKLMYVIKSEGEEWKNYMKETYQKSLEQSITYVACVDGVLCGYSRSLTDFGFQIWVIDLLVHKNYRGNSIGKKLLDCIKTDFPGQDIFILSDVDEYYQKLGYSIEGTIFKIQ
jgi:GNAT superfamily N-acetyltransferase